MMAPLTNPDAEAALLGLLLTQPDAVGRYLVTPAAFAEPRYAALYRAIRACAERGDPVGVAVVAADAVRHGASAADAYELAAEAPPTLAAGRGVVAAVLDAQRRRAMHRAGRVLSALATTESMTPEDGIAAHLESLAAETATESPFDAVTVDVAGVEWLTALAEAEAGQRVRPPALRTGQPLLDDVLGDLARGEVCVLAARPGVGKSALASQVATWNAQAGRLVVFASAEMPKTVVLRRLYAQIARVPLRTLRAFQVDGVPLLADEWKRLQTTTLPPKLTLFQRAGMTTRDISAYVQRFALAHPPDLVVVDHLHHLADRGAEKRHEQLTRMMLTLKTLAVRHDCAVLCLAQLNREGADVPTLRHLREAGGIEEIASVVALLHRPDPADESRVDVHVPKNRDGEVSVVTLQWEGRYVRFGA